MSKVSAFFFHFMSWYVSPSLLTMTNPSQMHEVLLFVCYKMTNALNCPLHIAQERSEEESSGDALALALYVICEQQRC